MDAGIAALVGAAIGSAGTLASTLVMGRLQSRSQHVQWRRTVRRDAYVHFIGKYAEALRVLTSAVHLGYIGRRGDDLHNGLRQSGELQQELTAAAATLAIEGPEIVASAAQRLSLDYYEWLVMAGLATVEPERVHWEEVRQTAVEMQQKFDAFTWLARETLDDPRGSL